MLLLYAVNLTMLAGALWALRQSRKDRELKKQIIVLTAACASFCLLVFLIIFFDFLEATSSGFIRAFTNNMNLITSSIMLLLFVVAHLTLSVVAIKGYLMLRGNFGEAKSIY